MAEALLRHGADVDVADAQGNTPLIKAAKGGHVGVVQVLLAAGANPELANRAGRTAADCAAEEAQSAALELLRQKRRRSGSGPLAGQEQGRAVSSSPASE